MCLARLFVVERDEGVWRREGDSAVFSCVCMGEGICV